MKYQDVEGQIMQSNISRFFSSQRFRRFSKFFLIGTVGWGINNLLLYLFDLLLGLTVVSNFQWTFWFLTIDQSVIASLLSMIVVVIFTFFMNKSWTFKGEEFHSSTFYQFIQFNIIGIVGFGIYSGLIMALDGTLNWNKYLAMVIAFYAGLINNFIWNELWTFNPKLIEKQKARKERRKNSKQSEVDQSKDLEF
jgi:putative flippase GtrA